MQKLIKSFIPSSRNFSYRLFSARKTNQMAPIVDKKLYVLQNDTPVVPLDCKKAFESM